MVEQRAGAGEEGFLAALEGDDVGAGGDAPHAAIGARFEAGVRKGLPAEEFGEERASGLASQVVEVSQGCERRDGGGGREHAR